MALLQVALRVVAFLPGFFLTFLPAVLLREFLRVSHALQPRSSVPMAAR